MVAVSDWRPSRTYRLVLVALVGAGFNNLYENVTGVIFTTLDYRAQCAYVLVALYTVRAQPRVAVYVAKQFGRHSLIVVDRD